VEAEQKFTARFLYSIGRQGYIQLIFRSFSVFLQKKNKYEDDKEYKSYIIRQERGYIICQNPSSFTVFTTVYVTRKAFDSRGAPRRRVAADNSVGKARQQIHGRESPTANSRYVLAIKQTIGVA